MSFNRTNCISWSVLDMYGVVLDGLIVVVGRFGWFDGGSGWLVVAARFFHAIVGRFGWFADSFWSLWMVVQLLLVVVVCLCGLFVGGSD